MSVFKIDFKMSNNRLFQTREGGKEVTENVSENEEDGRQKTWTKLLLARRKT